VAFVGDKNFSIRNPTSLKLGSGWWLGPLFWIEIWTSQTETSHPSTH